MKKKTLQHQMSQYSFSLGRFNLQKSKFSSTMVKNIEKGRLRAFHYLIKYTSYILYNQGETIG